MAHNIFDEKIYLHRQPAWHRLGTVSQEAHSAREAGEMIGVPDVYEREITFSLTDDQHTVIPGFKAIIGVTESEDGGQNIETYSIVSDHYHTVSHQQFIELFDRITHSRVETLGLLGNGSTMFVTAPLPQFDVLGDEIYNYMLMFNSLDGNTSIRCQPTSIRVVCQNTLQASFRQNEHDNVYRGVHLRSDLLQRTAEWLHTTWNQATGITAMLQEAYIGMARMAISLDQIAETIEAVYPEPDGEDEEEKEENSIHFDSVMELFEGSKTRTTACVGTAWGLYNAVVEYEDFAKRNATPQSILIGAGAERKKTAFRTLHAMTMAG
jgi:phage/plasmid-like protein (TIGR03299 family)